MSILNKFTPANTILTILVQLITICDQFGPVNDHFDHLGPVNNHNKLGQAYYELMTIFVQLGWANDHNQSVWTS